MLGWMCAASASRRVGWTRLSLAPSTVAIVKIDVEGHEMRTLEGMTGILEQSHPTLIVELEARHHPDAPQIVFNFLKKYGYEGYFIHRDRLKPLSDFSVGEFQNEVNMKPVFSARSPDYVNNFIFFHVNRPDLSTLSQTSIRSS